MEECPFDEIDDNSNINKPVNKPNRNVFYYIPFSIDNIPEALPPSYETKLPWEIKETQSIERERKRKERIEKDKRKKQNLINALEVCVTSVASATVDAISVFSEEILDSQKPNAEIRFRRILQDFKLEKFYGEYKMRIIGSADVSIKGHCYISSSFFTFHVTDIDNKSSTIMLPIRGLVSVRKAKKVFANYLPPYKPEDFQILPENNLNGFDSIILYTKDNMQHIFYNCKFMHEVYVVLEFVWQLKKPEYTQDIMPSYIQPDYISNSLKKQITARDNAIKYLKRNTI